jgi:hypothetical protein
VEEIIAVGFDEFADIFGEVVFVEVFDDGESHGAAVSDPEIGVGIEDFGDAFDDAGGALLSGDFESGGGFDDGFDGVGESDAIEAVEFGNGLSGGPDGAFHVVGGDEEFVGFGEESESGELAEEDADDGLEGAGFEDSGGLAAIFEGDVEEGSFAEVAEECREAGGGFCGIAAEDGGEHSGDVSIE